MTTTFRLDEIRLDTVEGPVVYRFTSDLTVLAGPTGVGKTSLLELVKYALGGDGLVASVAEESISRVHVDVRVGAEQLRLSRSVTGDDTNVVEVTDLIEGARRTNHYVERHEPSISDLLMTALGLPTGLRAAPRSGSSTRLGNKITFNDIFRFLYVSQFAINREIAGSSNSYYEPKRRTVFELLFDLTSTELVALRSDLNKLNSDAQAAEAEAAAVERFLADSGTTSRIEAELQSERARADGAQASRELASLTDSMLDVSDRETQALRDILSESERRVAEAQALVSQLSAERAEYVAERRRVELDIARLNRMMSAGSRLANIEFVSCPRCLQSLDREVPAGSCRVCLQDDVVADVPSAGPYELGQLQTQLEEISDQLSEIEASRVQAEHARDERRQLVQRLTTQIDERTRQRVSPRLQAYADAARRVERNLVLSNALEQVLRQWDRAEDLRTTSERIDGQKRDLDLRIRSLEGQVAARRDEVLDELTNEFKTTVQAFGIPNGQGATINRTSYLPEIAGRRYDKFGQAGGIATATQVAYWMSLLAVAARRHDTKYPGFLLIDSPRLALNTAEGMAAQMYRRFVTQVGVTPGRIQFIVADNELPAEYGADFAEIDFDYDNPTVPTVPHPGPANVALVGAESTDPPERPDA